MKRGDRMTFDDITIRQSGNRYELFHSLGFRVMVVDMVNDQQYFLDMKVLNSVAKGLSLRWKQTQPSKESKLNSLGYSNMNVVQTGISEYAIYLPNNQQIAGLLTPPDNNYLDDDKLLKIICKCLSLRYGIK